MYKKTKYRLHVIKEILPYTNKYKHYLAVSIIINAVLLFVGLLTPQVYKIFINDVVLGGRFEKFKVVILGYIFFYLLNIFATYGKYIVKTKFGNALLLKVKSRLLDNLFSMEYEQYDHMDIGELKMRIENDTSQLYKFIDFQSISLFSSYLKLCICGTLLFYIDWRLSLLGLASFPLIVFIDNKLSKKEKRLNEENRINEKNMSSWLYESISNWREVRALSIEKTQIRKYTIYLRNYAIYFCKWINYWTARVLVMPKIKSTLIMQFGLYFLGGILIINNALKIGDLLVFSLYFEMLSQAIGDISNCDADLQANMVHTDRVLEELTKNEVIHRKCTISELSEIVVSNLCFSYPTTQGLLLKNINMQIQSGDKVAIVGKSGVGKTTLLKAIVGMIRPASGSVAYNGYDIDCLNIDELHKRIGFVMQDRSLLNCSIRENLMYLDVDPTEEMLINACSKAYILDFIKSLPQGFDTIIGENGIKLSSGQRQRISLAKVFLRNPDIYIFDEATSNLDPYSEHFIHDAINAISANKIVIIVSHRESVLKLCNRIYSLDTNRFVSD